MMVTNLDAVLAHPYHGPSLKETISRWARTARYVILTVLLKLRLIIL
jgi:hypothetical protein